MNVHTDVQIIRQGDRPVFAVVPYDKWLELIGGDDEQVYIPHEVVGLQLKQGLSLNAAWRKHLGVTQQELANKTGMSQSAMAQIEKSGANPQEKTLKKIAKALGVSIEQISD